MSFSFFSFKPQARLGFLNPNFLYSPPPRVCYSKEKLKWVLAVAVAVAGKKMEMLSGEQPLILLLPPPLLAALKPPNPFQIRLLKKIMLANQNHKISNIISSRYLTQFYCSFFFSCFFIILLVCYCLLLSVMREIYCSCSNC